MLVTGSRRLVVEDVSRTQGRSVVVVVGRASSRPSLRRCPTDLLDFWLGCVTSSGFAIRAPSLLSFGFCAYQQHSQSLSISIVKYNVHTIDISYTDSTPRLKVYFLPLQRVKMRLLARGELWET